MRRPLLYFRSGSEMRVTWPTTTVVPVGAVGAIESSTSGGNSGVEALDSAGDAVDAVAGPPVPVVLTTLAAAPTALPAGVADEVLAVRDAPSLSVRLFRVDMLKECVFYLL